MPHLASARLIALIVLAGSLPLAAADHEVLVQDFGYQPSQLTIQAGDTVTWRNTSGSHNVVADGGAFSSGGVASGNWTFSHTFDEAGEFPYFCSAHGAAGGVGMSGRITVEAGAPEFAIQYGLSGGWFNPATPGQGFFVDVSPEINLIFVAWFTWNVDGGANDWLTAQGSYEGNRAVIPLIRTTGGRFNDSAPVQNTIVGEAEFIFESCNAGVLHFQLDDTEQQGTIPLSRLLPVPEQCQDVPASAGD